MLWVGGILEIKTIFFGDTEVAAEAFDFVEGFAPDLGGGFDEVEED